jgi:hypothetical protein
MIEQHHVVLNHAEPFRLRIVPGTGGFFDALQLISLGYVGPASGSQRFLIVPKNETNRSIRLDVRNAEDARQLHDDCSP